MCRFHIRLIPHAAVDIVLLGGVVLCQGENLIILLRILPHHHDGQMGILRQIGLNALVLQNLQKGCGKVIVLHAELLCQHRAVVVESLYVDHLVKAVHAELDGRIDIDGNDGGRRKIRVYAASAKQQAHHAKHGGGQAQHLPALSAHAVGFFVDISSAARLEAFIRMDAVKGAADSVFTHRRHLPASFSVRLLRG